MRKVEFTEQEKEFIKLFIVANSLADDRVYNRSGHEFEFDKDNLPFLGDMSLFVTVSLWEEIFFVDPPETPTVKQRVVQKLEIWLMQDGEQVETNLDFEFEEQIKIELIN